MIGGETRAYIRADIGETFLATHFCGACGATTHWTPLHEDAPDRMGVNMRLFELSALAGVEVRYGNLRNEAPDAPHYYREPTIFDGVGAPA